MKKYCSKQVTIEKKEIKDIICDRCGESIPIPSGWEYDEFTLISAEVATYPESSGKHGWQVEDLCESCVSWLKELLTSKNVKISEYKDNW